AVDDPARVAGRVDVIDRFYVGGATHGELVERLAVGPVWGGAHHRERGLQPRERLHRRARAWRLVAIEQHLAIRVHHGEEALREATLLNRVLGLVLAREREGVDVLAAEALDRRDKVARD